MNIESQLIFFFSALGAFNGFFLSFYFAYKAKKSGVQSNYFLALLLLVLSIRIVKSVFFYFVSGLSTTFLQIGLSACFLIGPFLFLYIQSQIRETKKYGWLLHIAPFLLIITVVGIIFPYWSNRELWSTYFLRIIYLQWLAYIILSGFMLRPVFKKLFHSSEKFQDKDLWLTSIFFGTTFIWIGYFVASFTSYIVGALSFSFILYLIILVLTFRRKKTTLFFDEKVRYKNKEIDTIVVDEISNKLKLVQDKALFKNANIKLADVAAELNTSPHTLSQYLNDNLGKSFSLFINEYRIEEAKKLLLSNDNFTIEVIGYESGFNSKSTFFTTFKNIVGITPSAYQKQGE
ncbi:AraC-like DNA-binding protein [Saonia flava]|uniref:AraC-like DNA-binding protein n=1 Tax=Saonia flava TaxID=523696 RepID=A0A846R4L4_9FLAO|nr:helix-turn-helix domain-containing protein [Saonia flava]NJB72314.1 AraC-like DNA-binding protein [Saonia flava]